MGAGDERAMGRVSSLAETMLEVARIYEGSDGAATRALYERLETRGLPGIIAVNLLRASKSSGRAKVYRGRDFRIAAYDRKQWSLDNLREALTDAGDAGPSWGWGEDPEQPVHRFVLYVDLPTGQVSFHSATRGDGPDYPGQWDGIKGATPSRVIRYAGMLLHLLSAPVAAEPVA